MDGRHGKSPGGGSRRSRRALLAGAAGALGAVAAETVITTAPAQAANGGNVILGQGNSATSPTTITNSTPSSDAIVGSCSSSGTGEGEPRVANDLRGTNIAQSVASNLLLFSDLSVN